MTCILWTWEPTISARCSHVQTTRFTYVLNINNAKTRRVLFTSWIRLVTVVGEKKWKLEFPAKVAWGALFLRDTQMLPPSSPSASLTPCRSRDGRAVDRLLFCHTRLTFPNLPEICTIFYVRPPSWKSDSKCWETRTVNDINEVRRREG